MKRAVVLAGGLGMRLRPYTTVLPKPLMPIGDRPILDVIVRQLSSHGFERLTIVTGHLAELIEAFFGDGERFGIPIDYYREEEPLGTVGGLRLLEGLDEDFLVMNGDVLTDLDYSEFLDEHRASDAAASIAAHRREVQVSLGVLELKKATTCDDRKAWVEKLRDLGDPRALSVLRGLRGRRVGPLAWGASDTSCMRT